MIQTEDIKKVSPFIQKEAHYLDDKLNVVRVLFSFYDEGDNIRVSMKGYRFGALKDEDVLIDDVVLDRETVMEELDAMVQKEVDKLGSLDIKVASLDVLIRATVPEIPGLHRFLDLYGGDVTVEGKRHALTRTRIKATLTGIQVSAHAIVSKKDSDAVSGNLEGVVFSLYGAKAPSSDAKGIQQSTVRELEEFDFFTLHSTVPYFNVTDGFGEENPDRLKAAKALLRIPHDMQYRDYVVPTTEDVMALINQTRQSSVSRILSSRKLDLDIEI